MENCPRLVKSCQSQAVCGFRFKDTVQTIEMVAVFATLARNEVRARASLGRTCKRALRTWRRSRIFIFPDKQAAQNARLRAALLFCSPLFEELTSQSRQMAVNLEIVKPSEA